ncbi:hypothetical protein T4A_3238, partial [Trichinella pseudospiralis]
LVRYFQRLWHCLAPGVVSIVRALWAGPAPPGIYQESLYRCDDSDQR